MVNGVRIYVNECVHIYGQRCTSLHGSIQAEIRNIIHRLPSIIIGLS